MKDRRILTSLLTCLRAGERDYVTTDEYGNSKMFVTLKHGNGLAVFTNDYHHDICKAEMKICGLYLNKDFYVVDSYACEMPWNDEAAYKEIGGLYDYSETCKQLRDAFNNKLLEIANQKPFMNFDEVTDEFKAGAERRAWDKVFGKEFAEFPKYSYAKDDFINIILGVTSVDELAQKFYDSKEEEIQYMRNLRECSERTFDFSNHPLVQLTKTLTENGCVNVNCEFKNEDQTSKGVVVAERLIYSIRNRQNISEWNGFKNREESSRVAYELGGVRNIMPEMITKVTYKKKVLFDTTPISEKRVAGWIKRAG